MNLQLRIGRIQFAIWFLALFVSSLAFAAPSLADNVRSANFTGLTDQALSEFLARTLKPELKELIKRNNLAVFALTAAFEERRACYGYVGLTEAPPLGRHARRPKVTNSSFRTIGTDTEWSASDCNSKALTQATEAFDTRPFEEMIKGIEYTKSLGKTNEKKPPDAGIAGISECCGANSDSLLEVIHKFDFGKAFDYRQVRVFVNTDSIQFDNGNFMCVAVTGLAARGPDDRNSRWPGSTNSFVRVQVGGDASGCKQFVAEQAVNELLSKEWTPQGLLKNFAATREDGVGLPDPIKVAKAKALIDRASQSAPVSAPTRSTNRVTCTNNCVNGSCLRKFADGRTERWQAPRKFNPLTNSWEWDITTNSCGL